MIEYSQPIPTITTAQMIEVDRLMIEEYNILLMQMMENAGRCLAILARDRFLEAALPGSEVIVLAGTGGNGGGALVAARRLHSWGANIHVFLTADSAEKMTPVPKHQLEILIKMGIPVHFGNIPDPDLSADLILDGIIGYSVQGDPRGVAMHLINWSNANTISTLSLDTPSGLDLTTGTVHHPTVMADATLTLALPKKGLYPKPAKTVRGELYLGDISVPPELYQAPGLALTIPPLFAQSDVLRID